MRSDQPDSQIHPRSGADSIAPPVKRPLTADLLLMRVSRPWSATSTPTLHPSQHMSCAVLVVIAVITRAQYNCFSLRCQTSDRQFSPDAVLHRIPTSARAMVVLYQNHADKASRSERFRNGLTRVAGLIRLGVGTDKLEGLSLVISASAQCGSYSPLRCCRSLALPCWVWPLRDPLSVSPELIESRSKMLLWFALRRS